MIKAYLTVIPTLYEGEDIQIRYSVYEDETNLFQEMVMLEYRKPAVAGQFSVITLLKRLAEFKKEEVLVYINDASLDEFLKGTSRTRNVDMLKMARETRKHMDRYEHLQIVNVSNDKQMLAKWREKVEFGPTMAPLGPS